MTVILDGILNEIASSFVSLTSRNDGDLMGLLQSLCSLAMTQIILEFPSFLLASSAAGLPAGLVRGCFCEFWLGEPQSPKDSAILKFPK